MKLYLEQLINALSDSDIQKLKNIGFKKSRIKDYLNLLIDLRETGIPDKKYFLEKLDIDDGGFRKMKTVLLNECLNQLVPEQGFNLIVFLGRYRLSELFIREVAQQKIKIDKKNVTDEVKAKFYWACFNGYIRLPFSNFSIFELSKISSGFLVAYHQPDKPIYDCIIQLHEIYIQIIQSFFRLEINDERYAQLQKQIQNIEKYLLTIGNKRLNVFAKGIRLILEFYFKPISNNLLIEFNNLVKEYYELPVDDLTIELIAVKFYEAQIQNRLGHNEVSLELFNLIENEFSNNMHEHPHVIYRYAQILLLNDKINECKILLDKYMKKYLMAFDQDTYVITSLIYAACFLLHNEEETALEHIRNCHSKINKKTYLHKEILIRFYELICFIQKGDVKFSIQLLNKMTKYLRTKNELVYALQLIDMLKKLQRNFKRLLKNKISIADFEIAISKIFTGQNVLTGKLIVHAARRFMKNAIAENID